MSVEIHCTLVREILQLSTKPKLFLLVFLIFDETWSMGAEAHCRRTIKYFHHVDAFTIVQPNDVIYAIQSICIDCAVIESRVAATQLFIC